MAKGKTGTGGGKPRRVSVIAPQVQMMVDAFGDIQTEETITHGEIEEIIGEVYGSGRYQAIVNAFKARMLNEDNRLLVSAPGDGYFFADNKRRIAAGSKRFLGGIKRIHQASETVAATPDNGLDPDDIRRKHCVCTVAAAMIACQAAERRALITDGGGDVLGGELAR